LWAKNSQRPAQDAAFLGAGLREENAVFSLPMLRAMLLAGLLAVPAPVLAVQYHQPAWLALGAAALLALTPRGQIIAEPLAARLGYGQELVPILVGCWLTGLIVTYAVVLVWGFVL
jgi:hypothetical protein